MSQAREAQSLSSPKAEKLDYIKRMMKRENYFFTTQTGGYFLSFPERRFSVKYNPRYRDVEVQEIENGQVKDRLILEIKEAIGKLVGAAQMYAAHGLEAIPSQSVLIKVMSQEKRNEVQRILMDSLKIS